VAPSTLSGVQAAIADAREKIAGGDGILPTAVELKGPELLAALVSFLRRYVIFANPHQAVAIALWIVHSHAIDAAEVSPRLHIRSPERRCGKSRLMDILDLLVAAPLTVMNVTEAALFRTIAESPRTLLHDEVDAVFGQKAPEHEGLRALINAGHQRGRTVARMVPKGRGFETREFPSFAATALAGIGDLPHTVADRAIAIRLERKLRSEPVERFRRRVVAPEAEKLAEQLALWAVGAVKVLGDAWPDLPEELDDRAADGWEPLLAIADLAGGPWPERARAAALALNGAGHEVDDDGIALQLLSSVRDVFIAKEETHGLWTKDELLPGLLAMDDAPWGAWNKGKGLSAHQLGKHLRQYEGVLPQTVHKGDRHLKGYLVRDLGPHWERYLNGPRPPVPGFSTCEGATPCDTRESGRFDNVRPPLPARSENGQDPLPDNGSHVRTDENAEQEAEAETEVELDLAERCADCGSTDVYLHRHDDGAALCRPCVHTLTDQKENR